MDAHTSFFENKYFMTVGTYEGDRSRLKESLFELFVAIGRVDERLGAHLRTWIKGKMRFNPDDWKPEEDKDLDPDYTKSMRGKLMGYWYLKQLGNLVGFLHKWQTRGKRPMGLGH